MTTRSKMNPDDRRKIASEDAVIEEAEKKLLMGNSLEVLINGKRLLHAWIRDQPTDDKEMIVFLKELVAWLEAPDVPDREVLGKYSPTETNQPQI